MYNWQIFSSAYAYISFYIGPLVLPLKIEYLSKEEDIRWKNANECHEQLLQSYVCIYIYIYALVCICISRLFIYSVLT